MDMFKGSEIAHRDTEYQLLDNEKERVLLEQNKIVRKNLESSASGGCCFETRVFDVSIFSALLRKHPSHPYKYASCKGQ